MGEVHEEITARVQVERLEVVDPEGRVRVIAGDLGDEFMGYSPGIALLDEEGRRRAWVSISVLGTLLVFDRAGVDALVLGVADEALEGDMAGGFVVACDAEGRPLHRLGATP